MTKSSAGRPTVAATTPFYGYAPVFGPLLQGADVQRITTTRMPDAPLRPGTVRPSTAFRTAADALSLSRRPHSALQREASGAAKGYLSQRFSKCTGRRCGPETVDPTTETTGCAAKRPGEEVSVFSEIYQHLPACRHDPSTHWPMSRHPARRHRFEP